MKKSFLFFVLIANILVGRAQVIGNYSDDLREFLSPVQSNGVFSPVKKHSAIEGTPYLFSDWSGKFEIFSKNNTKFVIENLNYNIRTHAIELKTGKDSVFQFDPDKIDFLKSSIGKYKFYMINGENQLCQELFISNKTFLLKGYYIVNVKEVVNPMTDAVISKARFDKKEKYFCKLDGNEFVEFDLKKKSILKLFGDKSSQVLKFVSDSKLEYSSENDIIKIFNYYDTL